jgi:hypothetical protein
MPSKKDETTKDPAAAETSKAEEKIDTDKDTAGKPTEESASKDDAVDASAMDVVVEASKEVGDTEDTKPKEDEEDKFADPDEKAVEEAAAAEAEKLAAQGDDNAAATEEEKPAAAAPVVEDDVNAIFEPAEPDILSGRGASVNAHGGNKKFRALCFLRKPEFEAGNHAAKRRIATEIVAASKAGTDARFLKKKSDKGPWFEMTNDQAILKACQVMRDYKRPDRVAIREMMAQNGSARKRQRSQESTPMPETTVRSVCVFWVFVFKFIQSMDSFIFNSNYCV